MIKRIDGMPDGTIGLRASGKLTGEEYRDVLEPALQEGIDSGELRLVFELTDFDGLERSAAVEDMKTGFGAWFKHHSAWKRFAIVTDVEWVAKAMHMFAWMAPGEVKIYENLADLEEAKEWAAA